MRSLIADLLVSLTGTVVRWVDPSIRDVHLVRTATPFGDHLGLPVLSDPCVPRGKTYIKPASTP